MPDRPPRIDHAQALLYHARSATPFLAENGEACISVPSSVDSRLIFPLSSSRFRDWLTARFFSEFETAPSTAAYRAALRTLEARARYGDFPVQKVDRRVSFEGDPFTPSRLFLDLANRQGEVLEISSQGWQLVDNLHHPFRQSPTALPLPRPEQVPSAEPLERFANLFRLTNTNRTRAFAWLATALRPVAPYPILVLRGPAASGKSVLARALRTLIDPSTVPVRRLPARDRELLQFASQNWVLVFDHVNRIPSRISEALCAVSSGDTFEISRFNHDPVAFQVSRPVILIAPDDETRPAWTPSRTLSNRSLTIDLAPISALRPEAALWSEFEAFRPVLLAATAEAIATALRRARQIDLAHVARFPDCATWAAAAAPALGLDQAAIVNTFNDSGAMWAGSDPLRESIYALLATGSPWTGSATELLTQLRTLVPLATLPATPKGLSQALPRIRGILVTRKRDSHGERILTITKVVEAPERTPATAYP